MTLAEGYTKYRNNQSIQNLCSTDCHFTNLSCCGHLKKGEKHIVHQAQLAKAEKLPIVELRLLKSPQSVMF